MPKLKIRNSFQSILCIIFISLISVFAKPKNIIISPVDYSWIEKIRPRITTGLKNDEVTQGYANILVDRQINLKDKKTHLHICRKIFSDLGAQNGSEVRVEFDPKYEKLIFNSLKIWRGDKSLDKLDLKNINVIQKEKNQEIFMYDGHFIAYVILDDIREGDVIEYSFTIEGFNPLFKYADAFDLQYSDPIDELYMRFISPLNQKLYFKTFNTSLKPTEFKKEDYIEYIIHETNSKGISMDDLLPSWYIPQAYVCISSYTSWKELKDQIGKIFEVTPTDTRELDQIVREIETSSKTKEEKLLKTVKFVQNKIRYTAIENGINGFVPHPPDKVLSQRYGDCKDKSLLFCYLAKRMGIDAYPAFVNSSNKDKIKEWLPSPYAFNHCIAMVMMGKEELWYDLTSSHQEGAYNTINMPDYGQAIVLDNQSEGLVKVKNYMVCKIEIKEEFFIDPVPGKAIFEVETKYYGAEADGQRYYIAKNDLNTIKNNFINYYAKAYPSIEIEDSLSLDDDTEQNIFITHESYKIDNFWIPEDSAQNISNLLWKFYPLNFYDRIYMPTTKIRKMPLYVYHPYEYIHNTVVNLPEDWTVKNDTITISNTGFDFGFGIHYKDRILNFNYYYKSLKDHIPTHEVTKFLSDHKLISSNIEYQFSYNTDPKAVSSFSWMMAFVTLVSLIIASSLCYKVYYYDPIPENIHDYGKIEGWLIFFAFGLCITPFTLIFQIYKQEYFNQQALNVAIENYGDFLIILVAGELAFNIISIIFFSFLIYLFLKRRSSVPRLVVIANITYLVFLIGDEVAGYFIGLGDIDVSLFKSILSITIWVLYFTLAERVKNTFTQTLSTSESIPNN